MEQKRCNLMHKIRTIFFSPLFQSFVCLFGPSLFSTKKSCCKNGARKCDLAIVVRVLPDYVHIKSLRTPWNKKSFSTHAPFSPRTLRRKDSPPKKLLGEVGQEVSPPWVKRTSEKERAQKGLEITRFVHSLSIPFRSPSEFYVRPFSPSLSWE